ncbi:MAG: tRNA lysidine(34) synthetase TilS [Flavobacteriales bacterium]
MKTLHHLISRFEKDLTKCLVADGELIIAACSGGVDSMCLVNALLKVGAKFEVAHVNFQLRGEDSQADAKNVQDWCEANSVVYHMNQLPAEEEATRKGDGIQDAARRLRYAWFEELRTERGAACVAVAHHMKDQTETLLIQLLRGVSPSSLGGMSPRNVNVIRPFLSWSQEEIEEWVALDRVPYREDKSNQSPKYLRNRIRNEVLPLLESIRAGSVTHIAEWADRLRSQAIAVESSISDATRDIVRFSEIEYNGYDGEICRIHLKALWDSSWGEQVFDRLLAERHWPYGARKEAFALGQASIGAEIRYESDSLTRERDFILLRNIPVKDSTSHMDVECAISEEEGSCESLSWRSEINDDISVPPTQPQILWIDLDSLKYPLLWRIWREGDQLEPTGMAGTVNVSDLLTQWKVPNISRKNARVLADARGQILWVFVASEIGAKSRISRNVQLTEGPKKLILEAKFSA